MRWQFNDPSINLISIDRNQNIGKFYLNALSTVLSRGIIITNTEEVIESVLYISSKFNNEVITCSTEQEEAIITLPSDTSSCSEEGGH